MSLYSLRSWGFVLRRLGLDVLSARSAMVEILVAEFGGEGEEVGLLFGGLGVGWVWFGLGGIDGSCRVR